jgi:hypothetical protein
LILLILVDLTIVLKLSLIPWWVLAHVYHLISTNLSQVDGYLKYESREAFQDNEALRSTPMVMSGPHSFGLSSGINNFISMKILSPSTLHMNSMHGSHLVCYFPLNSLHQFYDSNARFYDRIEAWLERSYLDRFPMNYQYDIFNMVDRVYHVLIFPTFSLFLFQALSLIFCLEHMLQAWDYKDGYIGIMTLHSSFFQPL